MSPERTTAFAERLQAAWLTRGALARCLLPLAWLFGAVTAFRRVLYQSGWLRATRLSVPVIVVGNLIAGGAGKTPTVIAIAGMLRRRGFSPGIISRGYGGSNAGELEVTRVVPAARCGDEPLLMHVRTGAPLVVGRDRVAAGRLLLHSHPQVDVIISDDGQQHLALARVVQVLVFDERGIGNGWLLPAGPLRETMPSVVPGRTLVVYNANAPTTPLRGALALRSLAGVVALGDWRQGAPASPAALDALRGRPLVAAAGIARPQRFFQMLRELGLSVTEVSLPDHYAYSTLPWAPHTTDVVLTEKDAIKLDPSRAGATRIWVAPLDFALDAAFESALFDLLAPIGRHHGNTPA